MLLRPTGKIHPMLHKLLLSAAGVGLTLLGLAGLLIPVMPGLLFLAGAVMCFSLVSPAFKERVGIHLFRQPRYRLARRRWNAAADLPLLPRLRLALWSRMARMASAQGRD